MFFLEDEIVGIECVLWDEKEIMVFGAKWFIFFWIKVLGNYSFWGWTSKFEGREA